MLHSNNGVAQITDPAFLLSSNQFSEQKEQDLVIKLYDQDPQQAFCRYPARLTYLSEKLGFKLHIDRYDQCPELKKFLRYVPFQQLELVFASEVLSSASSMMGHVFLKASGQNFRQVQVSHSLAYFTEITTINPAKLIVESTLTGMPGFFSVRPFYKDVEQYNKKEQRNVWQFQLQGTDEQLTLLQLHIWELNQVNLTYYFQSFNCATLTLELIALLEPKVLRERELIVSPLDVVKAATKYKMIGETKVDAADLWLYHALRDTMPRAVVSELDAYLAAPAVQPDLSPPLAKTYLTLAIDQSETNQRLSKTKASQLRQQLGSTQRATLDLSQYKHPALTPQDSALGFRSRQTNRGSTLLLDFLPAGHFIHSDNRQYLSESELQIAKTTLAWTQQTGNLKLDEFAIYSLRSLSPDTSLFPLWSGEFYLGYNPVYGANSEYQSIAELSAAAGKTYSLHKDVIAFGLLGLGFTSRLSDSYAFTYGKTGLSFNLAANSKLTAEYTFNSGKMGSQTDYRQLGVHLSWFPVSDYSFSVHLVKADMQSATNSDFGMQLVRYF